jgi:nucleoside recognition membrane protein YjiH
MGWETLCGPNDIPDASQRRASAHDIGEYFLGARAGTSTSANAARFVIAAFFSSWLSCFARAGECVARGVSFGDQVLSAGITF